MGTYLLKLPKMGESVAEATITNWLKEEGDTIALDESVVEIATDKVDSDVPSEVAGILIEKVCGNAVVQVGRSWLSFKPMVRCWCGRSTFAAIVEATPDPIPTPEPTAPSSTGCSTRNCCPPSG